MVGPVSSESNVLRATDGERFVVICNGMIFREICQRQKQKGSCEGPNLTIEILLYAIMYPVAIELFAFQNYRCARTFRRKYVIKKDGPPGSKNGLAKNFSITIMRLPRWKRMNCRKRSVEVGPGYFLIVFVGYSLL